jgi:hypothetical protein
MTDDDRRQLAELFREDDRLRAEHAQWMASREAAASPPMRENNPEGIVYRTNENGAQASAADSDTDQEYPSYGDLMQIISQFVVTWTNRKLAGLHRDVARLKKQFKTMGQEIETDRMNGIEIFCNGIERRFAALEAENIKIKALLGVTLRRLGHTSDADIIDLPANFWKRDNAGVPQ